MKAKEIAQLVKSTLQLENFTVKGGGIVLARKKDPHNRWFRIWETKNYDLRPEKFCLATIEINYYPIVFTEAEARLIDSYNERLRYFGYRRIYFKPQVDYNTLEDLQGKSEIIRQHVQYAITKLDSLINIQEFYREMEGLWYDGSMQSRAHFEGLVGLDSSFRKLMVLALVGAPYYYDYKMEYHEVFNNAQEVFNIYGEPRLFKPIANELDAIHKENIGRYQIEFHKYLSWSELRKEY